MTVKCRKCKGTVLSLLAAEYGKTTKDNTKKREVAFYEIELLCNNGHTVSMFGVKPEEIAVL